MTENRSFEAHLEKLLTSSLFQKIPSNLKDSIQYSLVAPGKRIRPRLVLATGQMLGLSEETLIPTALAIEMIHCFTLIHDDLPCMDNSDYRRGQLSNHKKFSEAVALLAGDGLVPLALETILQTPSSVTPARTLRTVQRLLHAIGPRGVIGGQAEEMMVNKNSSLADIIAVHFKKTGELFMASVLLPAELAGLYENKKSTEIEALEFFAYELGVGFQIADDFSDEIEDKDKPLSPTNILFYQKKEEAGNMAISKLKKATDGLAFIWKNHANPLISISNEVSDKILHAIQQKTQ